MSPLIIRLSGSLGPVEKSSPAPVRPVARILSHRGLPLGGDDGIRTHDPLLAGQVLSQLSYTPIGVFNCLFFQVSPESFSG